MYTPMYPQWGGNGWYSGMGKGKGGKGWKGGHVKGGNVDGKGGPGGGQGAVAAAAGALSPGTLWHGARKAAAAKKDRDAALAESLRIAEESDQDSEIPPATFAAGARHAARLAATLGATCPEASGRLEARAQELRDKALLAQPLAAQVQSLEKSYKAKIVEFEKLCEQRGSLDARILAVESEGLKVEKLLVAAKAKLVHPPPPPLPGDVQERQARLAIGQVQELLGLLDTEQAGPLGQALAHLVTLISPVEPKQPTTGGGASGVAQSAGDGSGAAAKSMLPPARPVQVGGTSSSNSRVGRVRGRSTSPRKSGEDPDFIPVRSRSWATKRLFGKQTSKVVDLTALNLQPGGARYFSRVAGLMDLDS